MQHLHFDKTPAWASHAVLLVFTVLPFFLQFNVYINILVTALLTVYAGCWRSVKSTPPTESMTKKDAMRFPIVGSGVLFGLFLLLKFLPKDWINAMLAVYFIGLGTLGMTATLTPFAGQLFPASIRTKEFKSPGIRIPYLLKEPLEIEVTLPELVMAVASMGFCAWYYFTKHWLANNLLGISFSLQGIEHLSVGSIQVGTILLVGLFFYDIFWVFGTPVMVAVAKNIDAPIKLLFPRGFAADGTQLPFAMLGLGDIVVPGMFVALLLRYDVSRGLKSFPYFKSAFLGYTIGLVSTIAIMHYFKAAQPALLYIVPAELGAVFAHAMVRGELGTIWRFSEAEETAQGKEAEAAAAASTDAAVAATDKKTD